MRSPPFPYKLLIPFLYTPILCPINPPRPHFMVPISQMFSPGIFHSHGVIHFTVPLVVAAFLFLFRAPPTLHLWASTFGYMNLIGVFIRLVLPCSPLVRGLTPANYAMKGSPGGLARIDTLFHFQTYTIGFTNSPLVFGAFPSLHSGNATLEALFLSPNQLHTSAFVLH